MNGEPQSFLSVDKSPGTEASTTFWDHHINVVCSQKVLLLARCSRCGQLAGDDGRQLMGRDTKAEGAILLAFRQGGADGPVRANFGQFTDTCMTPPPNADNCTNRRVATK